MIRNIVIQTVLSLYSNGESSVTSALKEAALGALKNGTITKPTHWVFDAELFVYNTNSITYLNGYGGLAIVYYQGSYAAAIYKSGNTTPAQLVYPYSMGDYDTLKITKIHLMAGGTTYATADVDDITFTGPSVSVVFTHTLATYPYNISNSDDWNGAYAIANALRTGVCDKILNLKYTTTTGGSTLYTANNFSWNSYVAHGETDTIAYGYPNNMKLVNSSGTAYASVTPYTASETPTDGNKYSFAFTLGTT